jgi:hypothetical protein
MDGSCARPFSFHHRHCDSRFGLQVFGGQALPCQLQGGYRSSGLTCPMRPATLRGEALSLAVRRLLRFTAALLPLLRLPLLRGRPLSEVNQVCQGIRKVRRTSCEDHQTGLKPATWLLGVGRRSLEQIGKPPPLADLGVRTLSHQGPRLIARRLRYFRPPRTTPTSRARCTTVAKWS